MLTDRTVESGFAFKRSLVLSNSSEERCQFPTGPLVRLRSEVGLVAEGQSEEASRFTPPILVPAGGEVRGERDTHQISLTFSYGSSRNCDEGTVVIDIVELGFGGGEPLRVPAAFSACASGEVFPRPARAS